MFRVLLALLIACVGCSPSLALENNGAFPPAWRANIGNNAGTYAITRSVAPDGRPAIRFELRAGDCSINATDDCATFRERTELRSTIVMPIGVERWHHVAMFVPVDYPGIGLDEIVGQFHDGDKPVLSNRIKDGVMKFVIQTQRGATAASGLMPSALLKRGNWTDLAYHVRWSPEADGFIHVYAGATRVFSYIGPNVAPTQTSEPILKIGIYRSNLDRYTQGATPTAVLYYAEPTIGTAGPLLAAVLPAARSVPVGATATAFATMINASGTALTGCRIEAEPGLPATFAYQTTNSSNQVSGAANTPVAMASGAAQGFVFAITPTSALADRDIRLGFACDQAVPASPVTNLNTFLLSSTATATPDMVAIGITATSDGVLRIPDGGLNVVAVAAINNAAVAGSVSVDVDDGGANLPIRATICQTNPVTGACLAAGPQAAPFPLHAVAAGEVTTYSVFLEATGRIAFLPAVNRAIIRFRTADGVTRGATSVAVCTIAAGSC